MRNILYDLKNRYPSEVSIYQYTSVETNQETGVRTATRKITVIRKAVLMPVSLMRKFIFDRGYLFANKQFTYGGTFDVNMRLLLVDKRDLPRNFELTNDDFIVTQDRRYELKNVEDYDDAYLLTIQETKGALPYAQIDLSASNVLKANKRLQTPLNLVVVVDGANLRLTWDEVSDATGYNVYRSTVSGEEVLYVSNVTGPYVDTNV